MGSPFHDPVQPPTLRTDLYVSGTTLFTLGLGDVTPLTRHSRELVILEAGMGFGLLAAVMGYFPVLYGAFSRREVSISLLDARAGSPPTAAELLRRHSYEGAESDLSMLLVEWERWSAELLESHISYPLLCYFRSQHTNQSWIGALTAILDTAALLMRMECAGNRACGKAATDVCDGAPRAGGPGADFLIGPHARRGGQASPGALRPALPDALPERRQRVPRRSIAGASSGDADAL